MYQTLASHSREAVEVFVYAINPDNGSPWRDEIRRVAEHFVDINPLSAQQAARRIRADAIDVLVNLNGYTMTARNGARYRSPSPLGPDGVFLSNVECAQRTAVRWKRAGGLRSGWVFRELGTAGMNGGRTGGGGGSAAQASSRTSQRRFSFYTRDTPPPWALSTCST